MPKHLRGYSLLREILQFLYRVFFDKTAELHFPLVVGGSRVKIKEIVIIDIRDSVELVFGEHRALDEINVFKMAPHLIDADSEHLDDLVLAEAESAILIEPHVRLLRPFPNVVHYMILLMNLLDYCDLLFENKHERILVFEHFTLRKGGEFLNAVVFYI